MNIYKISQTIHCDYDTFDSFIAYANNEKEAILMTPDNCGFTNEDKKPYFGMWIKKSQIDNVKVELIGYTDEKVEKGTILSSYNSG